MKRNDIINKLKEKDSFSRKDLKDEIKNSDPYYNLENVSSLIDSYMKKGWIIKEDSNKYCVVLEKKHYVYCLSDTLKEIQNFLTEKYPEIKFQVWEFSQLNEFLNHLLSTTTYVVEVEDTFVESFFEILKEEYSHVLLKPTSEDFFRYAKHGTIVVKKLISESPNDIDTPHQVRLEKMLVDIVVDKFTSKLINKAEIESIYAYCFKHYVIDKRKLLRYAKRRNAYALVCIILDEIER